MMQVFGTIYFPLWGIECYKGSIQCQGEGESFVSLEHNLYIVLFIAFSQHRHHEHGTNNNLEQVSDPKVSIFKNSDTPLLKLWKHQRLELNKKI